ncbi:MAG: phosphatidylglycerophosphatase A [Candidatus Marinimicrobia bacterium]|nr:phosphatidylglycerophosphatase A [Candidatus Neomarinimicrobiota bacterium]HJM46495.1 phosphatidylglycerophosphatase A [Candidatus Neomarinimicrobiota bacterium]
MTGFSIARLISSVGYVGRVPLAPGTVGSFAAFCAWYIISPKIKTPYFIFLTLIIFFIGVYVSKLIEKELAVHDPGEIVIDEWVGQWIALWFIELSLFWGLITFCVFRIFDIWKPWPVNKMDLISNGWGVMLDDVAASIYTVLFIQTIRFIF